MNVAGAILVASHLIVPIQDNVPNINIAAMCKTESAQVQSENSQCIRDEQNARDRLLKSWTQFPAANRASCAALSTGSGIGSYVELLTCLEVARDAKK